MAQIFGLDFGTTNSLVSVVIDDKTRVLFNQDDQLPHPSVVWYKGSEVIVGREARKPMDSIDTGSVGDFIRSPKRYLGSAKIPETNKSPVDVVADILKFLKQHGASKEGGKFAIDRVVMTVPVNAPGSYRRALRQAARKAGIAIHQFVHEPLAALYGYLRSQPNFEQKLAELEDQLVLVFDWGGGTLDLTLCKVQKGMLVQIRNRGDDQVGGDEFDKIILKFVKDQYQKQHNLTGKPNEYPGATSKLIYQCELGKIQLSGRETTTVAVAQYGSEGPLEVNLSRSKLIELTKHLIDQGMSNIDAILKESQAANLPPIALCVATGGMVRMPYIRERLLEKFDAAKVPLIEHGDRLISQGAAWIANDGVALCLAKPFEILLGDDDYSTVLEEEKTHLPFENAELSFDFKCYCTDPRDGFATFQFARPVFPGRTYTGDPRRNYATLLVAVDAHTRPLYEAIDVNLKIDHDCVATITAKSKMVSDQRSREIHDLEFGLKVGKYFEPNKSAEYDLASKKKTLKNQPESLIKRPPLPEGAIKLRSNVSRSQQAREMIPGDATNFLEAIKREEPLWQPTERQHEEKMYYVPCCLCRRTIFQIMLEGSHVCKGAINNPQSITEVRERKQRYEAIIKKIRQREEEMNAVS